MPRELNAFEKRIQQEKTIEAEKLGIMGFEGKLGIIAKNLGQPITAHSSAGGAFSQTEWSVYNYFEFPDPIEDAKNNDELLYRMPTSESLDPLGNPVANFEGEEWSRRKDRLPAKLNVIGWVYDGLSRGMHLEIRCLLEEGRIVVDYQGYEVYEEDAGELFKFNSNGWIALIDKLYPTAKEKEKKQIRENQKTAKEQEKKDGETFWEKIKDYWGL